MWRQASHRAAPVAVSGPGLEAQAHAPSGGKAVFAGIFEFPAAGRPVVVDGAGIAAGASFESDAMAILPAQLGIGLPMHDKLRVPDADLVAFADGH